jgi:hypothetical protein
MEGGVLIICEHDSIFSKKQRTAYGMSLMISIFCIDILSASLILFQFHYKQSIALGCLQTF